MNSITLKSKATKEELLARLNGSLAKVKELDAVVISQSRQINDLQIKVRDQEKIIENQLKIIKSMPLSSESETIKNYTIITLPSKVRT